MGGGGGGGGGGMMCATLLLITTILHVSACLLQFHYHLEEKLHSPNGWMNELHYVPLVYMYIFIHSCKVYKNFSIGTHQKGSNLVAILPMIWQLAWREATV